MTSQAIKVYWGGARREDFDAILSEAFPREAKVYFAWRTGRWIKDPTTGDWIGAKDGAVHCDDFLGLYTHSNRLWAVVATRTQPKDGPMGRWAQPPTGDCCAC